MTVKLLFRNQEIQVKPGLSLENSLNNAGISPGSVLAIRDGDLLTEDEILRDGEVIRLVAVISGGSQ
jgi:sulfur carrier protein ThiS